MVGYEQLVLPGKVEEVIGNQQFSLRYTSALEKLQMFALVFACAQECVLYPSNANNVNSNQQNSYRGKLKTYIY